MVHKFEACGVKIAVDVNSGAVHVLDDLTYELLDFYRKIPYEEIILKLKDEFGEENIKEALSELESIEENGLLFSQGAEYENIAKNWAYRKPYIKSLCLHIAHDCNLRCKYCFASTGGYDGHREMMSLEVGKASIDFLLQNSGSRKNLEVDFFGGEPLMNFDVVKGIVDYARIREKEFGKNIRFTLTTNCILLDEEKRTYINENMYNVVLSIDGRKEINDEMRIRVDGKGSYDLIIDKIKAMVRERGDKSFYVRGTFTKKNLDFSKDVLYLADMDLKNISVEPVVTEGEVEGQAVDYALTYEDLPAIFDEYERLAYDYIDRHKNGKGFTFFHFMIDLKQGPCAIKRISGCSAGAEYMAVTPTGELYPCHQFVGQEEFKMGSVFTGIEKNDMRDTFHDVNIFTKPDCINCWAKFYCSGGCAANANKFNGDIAKPHIVSCELEKKRLECALAIKAILS